MLDEINEKNNLVEDNKILKNNLDNLNNERLGLIILWNEQDYSSLDDVFNDDFIDKAENLKNDALIIKNEVINLVLLRNDDINLLNKAVNNRELALDVANYYNLNLDAINITRIENINNYSGNIYESYLKLRGNENLSEEDFNSKLKINVNNLLEIIDNYDNFTFSDSLVNVEGSVNDLFLINLSDDNFNRISLILPEINVSIETKLSLSKEKCCTFNQCNSCCSNNECSNDESLYPILFIHGHTFNEENTPEFSMNAFTLIQKNMQDDGYINAGELDVSLNPSDVVFGDFGRARNAITARASYYYITHVKLGQYKVDIQKAERIENYAIRLKEIIDLLKYRTGKDKVNIVAHSMGGLVAREYINLFGSDSVDKVVLINTPNRGIDNSIYKACKALGSDKECDDMEQDSIFINRLNAKTSVDNDKVYAIRSVGCVMSNGIGDGVVLNESAYLDGAKNYLIKGKCTDALQTNLHSQVLNPDIYPETYELLLDILKE